MKIKLITNPNILSKCIAAALLVGGSLNAQVSAQSACKGLESAACGTKTSCSWVEGYERKDGRKVKSFCRTKSAAKSGAVKKAVGSSAASQASKKTDKKSS